MTQPSQHEERYTPPHVLGIRLDLLGLILGPAAMIAWLTLANVGLEPPAHRLAGIIILTMIWWITEPVPIAVTGLLSLALAVILGAMPDAGSSQQQMKAVFGKFSSPELFFLIGGMFLGRSMTRHGLDRRLALAILTTRWASSSPVALLAALGIATGLLSMWIANIAATAMIYPVAMGMITVMATGAGTEGVHFARSKYATALLLMVAYSSTVGGITTPIGTATNLIASGFFRNEAYFNNQPVDFFKWSLVGFPLTLVMFAALLAWMRWLGPPGSLNLPRLREHLANQRTERVPLSAGERNTLVVFLTVITLWMAPGPVSLISPEAGAWLDDHLPKEIVAILAPIFLYMLPVNWKRGEYTLEPSDFMKIDWGTLVLFGSSLSLGSLMQTTGLADVVGKTALEYFGVESVWAITAVAIAGGILLSEIVSNTATAAALVPVTFELCRAAGVDPLPPLMGVTFGASFGNALPVSTPPNAIVYGSGLIQVRRMVVAGIGLDVLSGVVIWCVLRVAFALDWTPFRALVE